MSTSEITREESSIQKGGNNENLGRAAAEGENTEEATEENTTPSSPVVRRSPESSEKHTPPPPSPSPSPSTDKHNPPPPSPSTDEHNTLRPPQTPQTTVDQEKDIRAGGNTEATDPPSRGNSKVTEEHTTTTTTPLPPQIPRSFDQDNTGAEGNTKGKAATDPPLPPGDTKAKTTDENPSRDEQRVDSSSFKVERSVPEAPATATSEETVPVVEGTTNPEETGVPVVEGRQAERGAGEGTVSSGTPPTNVSSGTPPTHVHIDIPASDQVSIFIINPDSRCYQWWSYFIIFLAVFSSFFTPLEFAFFTDFSEKLLYIIDIVVSVFFLLDFLAQFLIPYKDKQTQLMVYRHRPVAMRRLKSYHIYFEVAAWCPCDFIYAVCWKNVGVRFGLWMRLYRVYKVMKFFQNIGINNKFPRVLKSFVFLFEYVHTAGCIFYYLATIVPESREKYTWIGSLTLGNYHYSRFRQIGFGRRYLVSLYFAVITASTVGFGDVHAVSPIEMVFTTIYVLLSMGVVPFLVNIVIQAYS